jgi:site-specific DNA-methyltransferase (adenine-specific)
MYIRTQCALAIGVSATYNPQKTTGHPPVHSFSKHTSDGNCYGKSKYVSGGGQTDRYPLDVLEFKWDTQKSSLHSTQKPVSLCEYFVKTYSNEGDLVLDNCMGSASIGVACYNLNRNYIGMEKDVKIYNDAYHRIEERKNLLI